MAVLALSFSKLIPLISIASNLSQEQSSLWFVNLELLTWRASLDTFMNSTLTTS
uniref:Uncharacterized protein n=1 Tax=Brassica campestris TaxID=3711 RepID=A0A3P5ZU69_BRACM|nr:unnamed protein product [Brassica rapa]